MFGKGSKIHDARKQAIFLEIRPILAKVLSIAEGKIKFDSRFAEDLYGDSLAAIEMVMDLEEKYGLEISDEEAEEMKTVDDIAAYLALRKPE